MGAVDAVRSVLGHYATFSGRARRSEYWWFALFTLVLSIVASTLDTTLFGTDIGGTGPIYLVVGLALIVPSLAVSWRRMHDTDRSGAWALIGLIPIIGTIIFIVLAVKDSTPGPNRFGPSPKEIAAGYGAPYGPA